MCRLYTYSSSYLAAIKIRLSFESASLSALSFFLSVRGANTSCQYIMRRTKNVRFSFRFQLWRIIIVTIKSDSVLRFHWCRVFWTAGLRDIFSDPCWCTWIIHLHCFLLCMSTLNSSNLLFMLWTYVRGAKILIVCRIGIGWRGQDCLMRNPHTKGYVYIISDVSS